MTAPKDTHPTASAGDREAAFRRRLALLAGAAAVAGFVLAAPFGAGLGWKWLAPSGIVFGYLLVRTDRHRDANHPPETDGPPDESLGPANAITLFRGGLVAAVAGFLAVSPPSAWLPVTLFVTAAVLDAVDGAVARRTRETVLGARLDGATDAVAVAVGSALTVAVGALPAWYLVAGALWYAYAAVLYRRRRAGLPVYELPPSRLRPAVGTAQLGVIAVALLPGGEGTLITAIAGLALAALLASFLRDGLAATGRLGRESPPVVDS